MKRVLISAAGILAAYALFASFSAGKPIMGATTDYTIAAPVLAAGETVPAYYGSDFGYWHPPLFVRLLGFAMKVFGETPAAKK